MFLSFIFLVFFSCKPDSSTIKPTANPDVATPVRIQSTKDLSWLQGSWVSQDKSTIETWAVQGDSLAGNLFSSGLNKITEVLLIKKVGKSWVYISKTQDPTTGKNIILDLDYYSPGKLAFINPNYDFPNRVEYLLENEKSIRVTISGKNQNPASYSMMKLD